MLPAVTAGKTYSTQLIGKSGTTDEKYNLKVEYCQDFTEDGNDDIKVSAALHAQQAVEVALLSHVTSVSHVMLKSHVTPHAMTHCTC